MSLKISAACANAGIAAMGALLNGGTLEFFTGSPPTNTTDADSGTKLASLGFSGTAFGSASAGVITANAITSDNDCAASGTAGYFRAKGGGSVVCQGLVGTSGADINLNTTSIVQHGTLAITSLTWTQPQS